MKYKEIRWLLVLILLLGMVSLACGLPSFGGNEEETAAEDEEEEAEEEEQDKEEATEEEAGEESEDSDGSIFGGLFGGDEEEEDSADDAEEEDEPEATAAPAEDASSDDETSSDEEVSDEEVSTEEDAGTDDADDSAAVIDAPQSLIVSEVAQELNFDSYRMLMDMEITTSDDTGNETTQLISADIVVTTDPEASSFLMHIEGVAGITEATDIEMAQIEGTTYMSMPDFGCITTSEGEGFENPFADIMSSNQFLEDVGNAQFVGEEEVNGVQTLHYSFDETALEDEIGSFETAEGHVYIAKDEGYLVRATMEGEGIVDQFSGGTDQVGSLFVEFNIIDINAPLEVVPPAGCDDSAGGDSDYPVLDDATNVFSSAGVFSYSTETAFDDIVTFYEDSLTADGWQKSESESLMVEGSVALLVYTKDGGKLTISVTEDTTSDGFLVLILEE